MTIDGSVCTLEILDTAGQEEYSAMRDLCVLFCSSTLTRIVDIRNGQGFILVYSATSMPSSCALDDLRQAILRGKDVDTVPMVTCRTSRGSRHSNR